VILCSYARASNVRVAVVPENVPAIQDTQAPSFGSLGNRFHLNKLATNLASFTDAHTVRDGTG
jgi:hypothetical protein